MVGQKEVLRRLIQPVVEGLGFEYLGLEYGAHRAAATVRVYIDGEGGIKLSDCELVSQQVSGVLDVEDPIRGAYTLEISSPGFDRPLFTLAHYRRFAGSRARLRLLRPLNGRQTFTGTLRGVDGDDVLLECDDEQWRLPFGSLERGRLVAEEPPKKRARSR
jgi:ribosome maturation factor RimP